MGVAPLSSLPNLTFVKTSVRAADYTAHQMAQSPPSTVTFPALRELDIKADTAECVVALLGWSVVDPPRLTQLSVQATLTINDTSVHFLSITTAVSLMCCCYTLEHLTIYTQLRWVSVSEFPGSRWCGIHQCVLNLRNGFSGPHVQPRPISRPPRCLRVSVQHSMPARGQRLFPWPARGR